LAHALEGDEFGEPASRPSPGEDGDKVDPFGDERARHGDDRLQDLLQAPQRADG
jgi:hypothetical protein